METETVRECRSVPGCTLVAEGRMGGDPPKVVHLSRGELEAVVQYAYDVFGLLAVPSYDTEAERHGAALEGVNAALNGGVA